MRSGEFQLWTFSLLLLPVAIVWAADAPNDAKKPAPRRPPLIDSPDLIRLHPQHQVWINKQRTKVLVGGAICLREGALELLACLKGTKEHEAIVAVRTQAQIVHAALLAIGVKPGKPVSWRPTYQPASGPKIAVTIHWTDTAGRHQHLRGQDWIRNAETGKSLDHSWVFGGSGFVVINDKGDKHYLAEDGDFICVANFPSAMLDLPVKSSDSNDALLYLAHTERIPPLDTPVTLVLTREREPTKPEGPR